MPERYRPSWETHSFESDMYGMAIGVVVLLLALAVIVFIF
jgi:hypothetical protein